MLWKKLQTFPGGFGLFILLFGILFFFLPILYEENDDLYMMLIASGSYSGTPDEHLIFTHFICGGFFNFLYSSLPGLEWYTWTLVLIQVLACAFAFQYIIHNVKDKWVQIALLVFLGAVFIHFSLQIQFTKVAALATIGGVLSIRMEKPGYRWAGFILVLMGGMLRWEAAVLVLVLSGPTFLSEWIQGRKIIPSRQIIIWICSGIIVILSMASDRIYYSSEPDWSFYQDFKFLLAKIVNNRGAWDVQDKIPPEISQEDYLLLMDFFPNPEVIGIPEMESIEKQIDARSFSEKSKYFLGEIVVYRSWLFMLLVLVSMEIFRRQGLWRYSGIASFGVLLFLIFYITLNAVYKNRVFIPSVISIVFFLPYGMHKRDWTGIKSLAFPGIIFVLALGVLGQVKDIIQENFDRKKTPEIQFALINAYLDLDPNARLISYREHFNVENFNPFDFSDGYPTGRLHSAGWRSHIPFHKEYFNSFEPFAQGVGLFIRKTAIEKRCGWIVESIRKKNGIELEPRIVVERERWAIVEFIRKE